MKKDNSSESILNKIEEPQGKYIRKVAEHPPIKSIFDTFSVGHLLLMLLISSFIILFWWSVFKLIF